MPAKTTSSAKKRTQKERQKRFRLKNVNIGDEVTRWSQVKSCIGAQDDHTVAKCLIDCFLENRAAKTVLEMKVQTPASSKGQQMSTPLPGMSTEGLPAPEASSVSEGSDSAADRNVETVHAGPSSVTVKRCVPTEAYVSSKVKRTAMSTSIHDNRKKRTRVKFDLSSSDTEDMYDPDYDPDDPTFQPEEWDISIVQSDDDESLDECGIDEDVFDINVEEDESDQTTKNQGIGVPRIHDISKETVTEDKYVVTKECLHTLLDLFSCKECSICNRPLERVMRTVGCVVECKWTCDEKHVAYRWSSSPMLPNGVYLCNFQALSSIILSGNNFTKVAMFARFLSLSFPGHTAFTRVQRNCVLPVVSRYWDNLKQSALEEHRSSQLIVSGDGRMDSPGHSAKYCTYTIMNQEDKAIVSLEVVDKREVGLKSVLMEAKGFERAMSAIHLEGVCIKEVVTDAHPQISKIMRVSYPNMKHSYDMWHGAKNLGKKISKISCIKGNEVLKPWLKDVTNHFFHCAETCGGSVLEMKTKWVSVLNHITNRHSWALGQCDHGDLEEREQKAWLKPSSNVLKDLEKQVMDKRLLRTFPYYVTCQTTSEIESFNNHLLMYAPKRNAFSYSVYKCRCQLAAIDYTKHLKRRQLIDQDGKPRCKRTFSKAANNWSVRPIKEAKEYAYIPDLLVEIGMEYCAGNIHLSSPVELEEHHPQRISATIAPLSPPPTAHLREKQISRLKGHETTE